MSSSPASSSLVSPSSPRPSPFCILPTELVRSIIESTIPPGYHSETYFSRQATLQSLCLVSKLFYQIAKPLLHSVVQLLTPLASRKWEAVVGQQSDHARIVMIGNVEGRLVPSHNLESIARRCRLLSTLCISGDQGGIDFSVLSSLTHLKILRLAYLELEARPLAPMSEVVEVSLLGVSSRTSFSSSFNPTTFPSLKAFTWYGDQEDSDDFGVTLLSLVDQVEVLGLDASELSKLSPTLVSKLMDNTLFDQKASSSSILPSVRYLRLFDVDPNFWNSPSLFGTLTKLVSQSTSKFTLYLPSNVEPIDLTSGIGDAAFEAFKGERKRKSIEIVFESQPNVWTFDIGISSDFWKRMTERKGRVNESK